MSDPKDGYLSQDLAKRKRIVKIIFGVWMLIAICVSILRYTGNIPDNWNGPVDTSMMWITFALIFWAMWWEKRSFGN